MNSHQDSRSHSFPRYLALGLLSLPLLIAGGCGGGETDDGGAPASVGGAVNCVGVECAASGGTTGVGGSTSGSGASASTGSVTGAGGTVVGVGGTTGAGGTTQVCTDIQAPDHPGEPCQQWVDWGLCDEPWMLEGGYCNETCGRCTSTGTGGTTGNTGGSSSTGGQGGGPTLPNIPDSAQKGWASRYWDCCKPSCAWSGKADSCASNGTTLMSQNEGSKCANEGNAYACNSEAPRALSSTVSYGYVAQPKSQLQCGVCYHLQFTGASHNAGNDPGSQSLAGKHMIVKVSNDGGDVMPDQLDLMVPGGGVGINPNTCGQQWGTDLSGIPTHGGFLTQCKGDYEARKSCVKNLCNTKVPAGTLRDACNWYVDWFGAADNPVFKVEQTNCPSDI